MFQMFVYLPIYINIIYPNEKYNVITQVIT